MTITSSSALPSLSELPENYCINLSDFSAISLAGEEQSKYLQGQVTCDVNNANEHSLMIGAHCDAKGKVFSVFRLINRNNAHLLIQPSASITDSLAELKKFGVFAKVEITQTQDLSFAALVGEKSVELLQNKFSQVPDSSTPVVQDNSTTLVYVSGKQARYLLIDSPDNLAALVQSFELPTYTQAIWNLLEITEGFPILSINSCRQYVPQMLNLQAINGISFTKGCYLGQETVARMQYLGKNKRALFSLTAQLPDTLNNDNTIEKQLGENWRKAGDILASYQSDNGTCYLQAVLANDGETQKLRLGLNPETVVTKAALPYALVSE
ncbi:tRNA-modifying protein YgfZ [Colwellia asteriadis]|uniref:tRNA-modifying protein YgfZ n=1 Tax=Colwellia asteriadis TaxID=517723 RepID=A0ABN1L928_9GAMM